MTKREAEVLLQFAQGAGARSAADALGVGVETINTHLDRARRKLAARNTTHAVAIAIRSGLVVSLSGDPPLTNANDVS